MTSLNSPTSTFVEEISHDCTLLVSVGAFRLVGRTVNTAPTMRNGWNVGLWYQLPSVLSWRTSLNCGVQMRLFKHMWDTAQLIIIANITV